jgi:lipoprotein-anchoring transpeptidase ErfK/SrfK
LIVVSIPSQRLFVFRDGEEWATSKVSTGRRGHETPVGVFPILQKKAHHRSNLYDDAPMPYMQRLTWGGVALHAGQVPGYPASHGCIRLPKAFAKKLYGITGFSSTAVIVSDEPMASAEDALAIA